MGHEALGGLGSEVVAAHDEDLLVAAGRVDVGRVGTDGHDQHLGVVEDGLGETQLGALRGGGGDAVRGAGVDHDVEGGDEARSHVGAHEREAPRGGEVRGQGRQRPGRHLEAGHRVPQGAEYDDGADQRHDGATRRGARDVRPDAAPRVAPRDQPAIADGAHPAPPEQ